MPDKFIAMHGYDLRDHVAELGGHGDPDTIARIKGDYRETLAELHLEYVQTWVDWSHRPAVGARTGAWRPRQPARHLRRRRRAGDGNLRLDPLPDSPLPRPSLRDRRQHAPPLVNRMASSAAHVAGRPLASAETFTWLREHFHAAPSEAKPELDQLYLTGINRIYPRQRVFAERRGLAGLALLRLHQENSRNSLWSEFGGSTPTSPAAMRSFRGRAGQRHAGLLAGVRPLARLRRAGEAVRRPQRQGLDGCEALRRPGARLVVHG